MIYEKENGVKLEQESIQNEPEKLDNSLAAKLQRAM